MIRRMVRNDKEYSIGMIKGDKTLFPLTQWYGELAYLFIMDFAILKSKIGGR